MSDQQIDEFLEHHGVKGQKWGIRNQQRLDRVARVARGTATRGERTSFALTETSAVSLLRNRGIQGAAIARERELRARKKRILAGKASVLDFLALHGGDKLIITGK